MLAEITPQEDEIRRNQRAFEEIVSYIESSFFDKKGTSVKVSLYGSAASGLALRGTSDIDICVQIPQEAEELILNNNSLYEVVLEGLTTSFKSDNFIIQKSSVFNATFGSNVDITLDTKGDEIIKVGICLERPETLRHVELFKTYMQLDERVKPLLLLLKYWNKSTFSDPNNRMLTSHAVCLMVVSYLQHEMVLPRL